MSSSSFLSLPMLSKPLFIDRKCVFYAKRAYPRVKKERDSRISLFFLRSDIKTSLFVT
jgi:hypothetical protein